MRAQIVRHQEPFLRRIRLQDQFQDREKVVLELAGLRKIVLHTLRHTYASLLINQGESIKIKYVSHQLAHASIQITADLYGHLFRETGQAAMQRLERSIHTRELKLVSAEGLRRS